MLTAILPDTDIPFKTLTSDRLGNVSSVVETEPTSERGSIVIRISLNGSYSIEILAGQSDEADQLLERLTDARPLLEQPQRMFTVGSFTRFQ